MTSRRRFGFARIVCLERRRILFTNVRFQLATFSWPRDVLPSCCPRESVAALCEQRKPFPQLCKLRIPQVTNLRHIGGHRPPLQKLHITMPPSTQITCPGI